MNCRAFRGQRVEHGARLELHGVDVARFRVPPTKVVEALDVIEDVSTRFVRARLTLRAVRSALNVEKKLCWDFGSGYDSRAADISFEYRL